MNRGLWDRETVAAILLISAMPVFVIWFLADGTDALKRLIFFLAVTGIWHVVWMLARAQPPSLAGAYTALALAILAPQDLGLIALLLSTSFGVIIAELAFGGWGRNILNPATVTLAFMGFGYPSAPWPDLAVQVGWAAWATLAIGLFFGVFAPALALGTGIALGIGALAGLSLTEVIPALSVGLVLLVADPVTSASTRLGRWLNGLLYGGLAALFTALWQDAAPVQLTVSAALLTTLAAPLCDEIALAVWLRRQKGRHV